MQEEYKAETHPQSKLTLCSNLAARHIQSFEASAGLAREQHAAQAEVISKAAQLAIKQRKKKELSRKKLEEKKEKIFAHFMNTQNKTQTHAYFDTSKLREESSKVAKQAASDLDKGSAKRKKKYKQKKLYMPQVIKPFKTGETDEQIVLPVADPKSIIAAKEQAEKQQYYKKMKKRVKEKYHDLERQLEREDLTEDRFRWIKKEKKRLFSKICHYDQIIAKKRFRKEPPKQQIKAENVPLAIANNMTNIKKAIDKKPETQYQKYLQFQAEKQARAKQLLQQQQHTKKLKMKFEEQTQKSRNPVHSVSEIKDQMYKKGLQSIRKLTQKFKIKDSRYRFSSKHKRGKARAIKEEHSSKHKKEYSSEQSPKKEYQHKREQSGKVYSPKQSALKIKSPKEVQPVRKKGSPKKKYPKQEQFMEEENLDNSFLASQIDNISEKSYESAKVPKWRREIQKITGYNPRSKKYQERDKGQIWESGFAQIEKEDKISRWKARQEERMAELNGEVDDL